MSAGELTCNGGQELNSAGNCFNLSVIEFVPTHTMTQGPGGHKCTWIYLYSTYKSIKCAHTTNVSNTTRKPSHTNKRTVHYCNMQTQMDVIFQLSGSPHTSPILHISLSLCIFSPCESCLLLRHQCAVWQLSPQMFEKM